MDSVKSPCTHDCRYSYLQNICIGCYRTIEEISVWTKLNEKEKEIILNKVEERKKTQGIIRNE